MKIITTHDHIVSLENVHCVARSTREDYHTRQGKKYTEYRTIFYFSYTNGQTTNVGITESNSTTPKANAFWEEIQRRLSTD